MSGDDTTDHDQAPGPEVLNYSRATPGPARGVALTFAGFVIGAVLTLAAGFAVGVQIYAGGGTSGQRFAALAFVSVGVVAIIGSIAVGSRKDRRWLLMGALIGTGITCLVEGICYGNG